LNNFFLKIFMSMNIISIRLSKGRIGSRLSTQKILLLHSVGRKSGKNYVTPIAYFHLDAFYFLVGSNWGKDTNADWFYNLMEKPETTIEVDGLRIAVKARQVEGSEYERLWKYATEQHPAYLRYKEITTRHIPIVTLQPTEPDVPVLEE
jgi:deazaflavin-dependent oxidoreductase (nitroreductase family)